MEPIGTHGLACLSDTDWADYARYMQCQAEAIDSVLAEQMAALEGFQNRPTIILVPSASQTIASGVPTGNFYNTVLFNNSSFMSLRTVGSETFISIGSPVGVGTVTPYLRGVYLVGAQVIMDATGAVTAFSERSLALSASDGTVSGSPTVGQITDLNPDPNTTITAIGCSGAFSMVLRGTNGVLVRHTIRHNNAASTVQLTQANAIMWATYLGPTELVEVA